MTTTIFDSISYADFLRLTLQAFSRQGYAVEQSRAADADGVLLGKNGARIGILCKNTAGRSSAGRSCSNSMEPCSGCAAPKHA